MNSINCGHCKRYHPSVEGVKDCARMHYRGAQHAARTTAIANTRAIPQPAKPRPSDWRIKTPRTMVEAMREGRYAVAVSLPGQRNDWAFIRVSRPTRGKLKGSLVLQTQHSDFYKPLLTIYPSGGVYFHQNSEKLDIALMMIAADPYTSAINYGRELGCCSRCGRELTDDRSRYYSIGPECEKHWPEIINLINETQGVFVQ